MDRLIRRDRQSDRLNLLWLGLGLFMFSYAQPDIIMISGLSRVLGLCANIGTLLIFFSIFTSIKLQFEDRTRWAKTLIVFILLWHIFMALKYEPLDLLGWPLYFDPYSYTLYLYSLILIIPALPLVRSFFLVSRWLMLVGFPLFCLPLLYFTNFGAIQFVFEGFMAGAGLMLMTNRYHSKKWLWIAASALFFSFLVATLTARRNLMLTSTFYMIAGGYMILFKGKQVAKTTQIFVIMSGVVCIILAAILFMMNSNGIFAKIAGHAGENTRDYVFLLFFWDMIQTPLDMLLGRGIRGAYECQGIDGDGYNNMRQAVENGYLQLMLKGGIVYIIAYVTIFITAIRQAWSSKNQLSKASIFILIIQLVDMLPFGLHAVNLKTFMIWMCVSICLCPSICDKTDDELIDLLTTKKSRLPDWQRNK